MIAVKSCCWLYDRRDLKEAQQDLQAWLQRWAQRYPRLTDWVEAENGETLNVYRLPRQHHKHLKSTNLLERLNEEIKRRTRVVRIFPNPASCLRLIRALCAETHEAWLEDHRYLNMEFLKEQSLSHDSNSAQLDVHNRRPCPSQRTQSACGPSGSAH